MVSNRITSLLLLAVLVMLGGCTVLKRQDFVLLTNSSDAQLHLAQQQWLVQQGDKSYVLEVVAERSANHWRLILLNTLGQRLATAEASGGQVHVERLQSHPANQLLAELLQAWQLSYWPLLDLQSANPQWSLIEGNGRREASFSGILRASIECPSAAEGANLWQGSLSYNTSEFRLLIHSQPLN